MSRYHGVVELQADFKGFDIDGQINALLQRIGLVIQGRADAVLLRRALLGEATVIRLIAQACRQAPLFAQVQARCTELQVAIERDIAAEHRLVQAFGNLCQWVEQVDPLNIKQMEAVFHLGFPLVAHFLPEGADHE